MINTSANVVISKANEVFLRVKADPHIEYELRDHFTFQVESAKFMPQYRNRNWNGEIHLFDLRSKRIYVGLLDRIIAFCKKHDYTYKFQDNEYYDTMLTYLESILKVIQNRTYQIKNAIEFMRFNAGMG